VPGGSHPKPAGDVPGRPHPRVHTTTALPLTGRSQTLADTKRDTLTTRYRADPRVSPWAGTAHGVLQASQQPPAAPKLPLPLAG